MGRIKRALRNLSIKKTYMLYMLLFLLIAAFLSSVSINAASSIRNQINFSYTSTSAQTEITAGNGGKLIIAAADEDFDYSGRDRALIVFCDFVQTWSIPIFFGCCILLSSLLLYRNKLQKPVEILSRASGRISENDLDFHLVYDSRDEMGQLCDSFEKMRASLEENNRAMWRAMEDRKQLNAAFAHDLRTPLTVLRGYSDFLMNYLPQGKVAPEKLISTISTMSENISRLEDYTGKMSEVQRLEDIRISRGAVDTAALCERLEKASGVLAQEAGIMIRFEKDAPIEELHLDPAIVSQVFENVLSNALRYAQSEVAVKLEMLEHILSISVSDDGKGFTDEDLQQAIRPFYRNRSSTGGFHFGLGLSICRILCEKHGGGISLENAAKGGACVKVTFTG